MIKRFILVQLNSKKDFMIHKDKERRDKYLARAKKIEKKAKEFTFEDPNSANYWSIRLLWA